MDINIVWVVLAAISIVAGFFFGKKNKGKDNTELLDSLSSQQKNYRPKHKKKEHYRLRENTYTTQHICHLYDADADNISGMLTQKRQHQRL